MIEKIVSGGQTGADRGAIDAAFDCGFPYGGFIPKGRLAEDGRIDSKYTALVELDSFDYFERTKKNIEQSDGTVVIFCKKYGAGTKATIDYASYLKKPLLVVNLSECEQKEAVTLIDSFARENNIAVLNVAGPRESIDSGIYKKVYEIVKELILLQKGKAP